MKDGFIKTAAATPTIKPADCEFNCEKIIEIINNAHNSGVSLLCLPELCITGYTCGDLFFQQTLIDGALSALTRIAEATMGKEILTVVGLPMAVNGKLYNCAAALFNGEILGVVPKTNLPNYGELNEVRWFAPAPAEQCIIKIAGNEVLFGTNLLFKCANIPDLCVGIEICEDLWVAVSPAIRHTMAGATVIANPLPAARPLAKRTTAEAL